MVERNFEELHALPRERMRVIHNGVDVDRFTPAPAMAQREETRRELGVGDAVLFLMLAHNLLLKNAEALLRAAAKLKADAKQVQVLIAGGKKPDRFVKLAGKLGISDQVTISRPGRSVSLLRGGGCLRAPDLV